MLFLSYSATLSDCGRVLVSRTTTVCATKATDWCVRIMNVLSHQALTR